LQHLLKSAAYAAELQNFNYLTNASDIIGLKVITERMDKRKKKKQFLKVKQFIILI
jgi:hypothetical protein